MLHLDLTLDSPGENLALDEALWEAGEATGTEVLRFWESPVHFVVLGYANRMDREVNVPACEARGIPVQRRITGGGTVLQGPGCLNYTLVLRIADAGPTASITATNLHLMNRNAAALTRVLDRPVRRRGDTDLAIGDRKFSGNAHRRGRRALLFHGTFLLNLDLDLLQAVLPAPSRQPDYRENREHQAFVMNLEVDPERVKDALRGVWVTATPGEAALGPAISSAVERARELAALKYNTPDWNLRF